MSIFIAFILGLLIGSVLGLYAGLYQLYKEHKIEDKDYLSLIKSPLMVIYNYLFNK